MFLKILKKRLELCFNRVENLFENISFLGNAQPNIPDCLLRFESTCNNTTLSLFYPPQSLEFNILRHECDKQLKLFEYFREQLSTKCTNHNDSMIVDVATEISLTGFEFHPVSPLWPDPLYSLFLPLWVFHFSRPVPSYITANFWPTLETFEQLLVFLRPPCFIIPLSLSLSSHPWITRRPVISTDLSSVCPRYVVIFTPLKGYICV